MNESKGRVILLHDESSEIPDSFDWEALKNKLENKGMKFSILQTNMPVEPPVQMTHSVTEGMYPRINTLFKKE